MQAFRVYFIVESKHNGRGIEFTIVDLTKSKVANKALLLMNEHTDYSQKRMIQELKVLYYEEITLPLVDVEYL